MGIFEKVGLGMAGAAALGACSPEKVPEKPAEVETAASNAEAVSSEQEAVVMPQAEDQWTEEQREEILSGTTKEVDY